MKIQGIVLLLAIFLLSSTPNQEGPLLIVLGTVQDAGSPHPGCTKECCRRLFQQPDPTRMVVALGLLDPASGKRWLFEATPDLPRQMKLLKTWAPAQAAETPAGIFLTHAHIGHYSGLMYLGREGLNTQATPVYTMPKMKAFLEQNGPWSQLCQLKNIQLQALEHQVPQPISPGIRVTPILVPHRDEFSETVGFRIEGPNRSVLFIPDIDKWERWSVDILNELKKVDYAFLDATFYDNAELNYRNMNDIPHPFVVESMARFQALPATEKRKIFFIHLNHTNPLLNPKSKQSREVQKNGFQVARFQQIIHL